MVWKRERIQTLNFFLVLTCLSTGLHSLTNSLTGLHSLILGCIPKIKAHKLLSPYIFVAGILIKYDFLKDLCNFTIYKECLKKIFSFLWKKLVSNLLYGLNLGRRTLSTFYYKVDANIFDKILYSCIVIASFTYQRCFLGFVGSYAMFHINSVFSYKTMSESDQSGK